METPGAARSQAGVSLPWGLGAPTPRVSRKAPGGGREPAGGEPPPARPLGPTRGLSPARRSPPGPAPAQGQKPVTGGAQITLTRGQDHGEAAAGLLRLAAVARARFPGDSPPRMAVAGRGCPRSVFPPRAGPRLAAPSFASTRFSDGLRGRAGAERGLVTPVPGDFTAALQKNGSDFTRR